ncbi:rhodanese-like domain-containing protein [Alishewanella tabrizica]|nr:rhodanese-like domain-containing protein [Alishewanella tabrizica]
MNQFIEFIGNHPLLSGIWALLLVLIVVSWLKSMFSSIKAISPTQLTLLVNRENATVVDIRNDTEYRKGHITDAVNLTQGDIDNQKLAGLEKQKDAPIIVVCQAGMSASKAAASLAKLGFTKVSILQGGMGSWTGASLPVVKSKR